MRQSRYLGKVANFHANANFRAFYTTKAFTAAYDERGHMTGRELLRESSVPWNLRTRVVVIEGCG